MHVKANSICSKTYPFFPHWQNSKTTIPGPELFQSQATGFPQRMGIYQATTVKNHQLRFHR